MRAASYASASSGSAFRSERTGTRLYFDAKVGMREWV